MLKVLININTQNNVSISQDVRDRVRRLYVFDQMSLEMAALTCEVSFSTARRWKTTDKQKGDDWDKVRAANMMAGGGMEEVSRSILSGFLLQYQTTIEEINSNGDIKATDKVQLLTSLADAFNKTVGASRKVLPETSQLATALEVLKLLGEFVQTKHPKHMAPLWIFWSRLGRRLKNDLTRIHALYVQLQGLLICSLLVL